MCSAAKTPSGKRLFGALLGIAGLCPIGRLRRLFEREVPELASGAVSIMAIAREAGARTKIAVRANTPGINPKGALIGPGGSRVRAVMENLGSEKIDIIDWSANPAEFIAAALSPAVVSDVQVISEKIGRAHV